MPELIDVANDRLACGPPGKFACLCIIALGNGLDGVSAEEWISTHRPRYYNKLRLLRGMVNDGKCGKIILIFGGHGSWHGFEASGIHYIMEDVLKMARAFQLEAASGIEDFISKKGKELFDPKSYNASNHFNGAND